MSPALAIPRKRGFPADPGPDFPHFGLGQRVLYIRRDLAAQATAIFAALAQLNSLASSGAGNRGGGFPLKLDGGPDLFARCSRRGGFIRFINSDIYFGAGARPLPELAIANEARLRGLPIAAPLGPVID